MRQNVAKLKYISFFLFIYMQIKKIAIYFFPLLPDEKIKSESLENKSIF